jgi:hypothetical protein
MPGLSGSFLPSVWCVRATCSRVQHLAAAAGAARRGLIRSGRRVAPTSLCPPVWGRRGQTRYVRCALSAQTVAASMKRSAHWRARPHTGGHSHSGTSPPPGSACRSKRRRGIPTVARLHPVGQGVCGQAAARHVRRREAQWPWPRAQRASLTDSSQLSERRERSERSELCDGPRPRASQGSRCIAPTASLKRCGLPAHALAPRGATNELTTRSQITGMTLQEGAKNCP